jgi:transcription termination factor NusB
MSPLDRAIMVYAVYEFKEKISDFKLATNEAIEISKEYSDPNSYKLINAVLESLKEE